MVNLFFLLLIIFHYKFSSPHRYNPRQFFFKLKNHRFESANNKEIYTQSYNVIFAHRNINEGGFPFHTI